MTDMETFIAGMPKAELHLHIEGTIGPAERLALARRNGIALPYADEAEIAAASNYTGLEDFLRVYYEGIQVLVTERDFYEVTRTFLDRCRQENIIYVEISFDPQPHLARDIPFEIFMNGILAARAEARESFGVASNLIMCVNRDRPLDEATPLFDQVKPWRDQVAGFGLDSAEAGNPPEKFTELYARARDEGYRLTAHCDVDQENSVRHIRQCIDVLGTERIDHGVNCLEDPALVEELKARDICLTVCPTWRPSDPAPRRTDRLKQMFELGLRVTINTDDPGLFASGYLSNTLTGVQRASGYTEADMVAFMRNAFLGSWAGESEKQEFLQRLGAYG
jgi:adenosine deaminase